MSPPAGPVSAPAIGTVDPVEADSDSPPPERRGPAGSSAAARGGTSRRTNVPPNGKKPVTPVAKTPVPPVKKPVSPVRKASAPVKKTAAPAKKPTPPVKKPAPLAGSAASRILAPRPPRAAAPAARPAEAEAPEAVEDATVVEDVVVEDAVVIIEPAVAEPAVAEPEVAEPAVADAVVLAETPEPAPAAVPAAAPRAGRGRAPAAGSRARPPVARASVRPERAAPAAEVALSVAGLSKIFGDTVAVDEIDLEVHSGAFFGFVGPNGAGKTTTLSMVTGLLRPDAGSVSVYGADVWTNPIVAKRSLGVLPDRLRLFDRLTGAEYLHHAGALRGLDRQTIARRTNDLITAFGLEQASRRFVSDFSAGMVKKIAIAAAMIHSPRLLVLDEPFESVDPVSAQLVIDVLKKFAAAGGTVLLSSHSMDLIERVCDSVAIIVDGRILASGSLAEVLDGRSLEERFVEMAGGATAVEGMEWLQSFSD